MALIVCGPVVHFRHPSLKLYDRPIWKSDESTRIQGRVWLVAEIGSAAGNIAVEWVAVRVCIHLEILAQVASDLSRDI